MRKEEKNKKTNECRRGRREENNTKTATTGMSLAIVYKIPLLAYVEHKQNSTNTDGK